MPMNHRNASTVLLLLLLLFLIVLPVNGRRSFDTLQSATRNKLCFDDDENDVDDTHSSIQVRTAFLAKEERVFFGETSDALLRYSRPAADDQVRLCSTSAIAHSMKPRPLLFWENMVCGAISRSIAQTVMHPANTMKTILQSSRGTERPTLWSLMRPSNFQRLSRGAGANFLLSVPHGAVNFAVLEFVRSKFAVVVNRTPALKQRAEQIGPGLDFLSSSLSTVCCSIVSTPQMMITDNIMAGNFNNMPEAIRGLWMRDGIKGFYAGWWPGLAGKIPSYVSANNDALACQKSWLFLCAHSLSHTP
jgi:hypothetical protein